jgi:hypothetical protein
VICSSATEMRNSDERFDKIFDDRDYFYHNHAGQCSPSILLDLELPSVSVDILAGLVESNDDQYNVLLRDQACLWLVDLWKRAVRRGFCTIISGYNAVSL